ncbi:MAG: acyl-CoA dehydrogenase family protein [Actinomycetota bacterium]|nr:acyl-CoA dehydrogenase family protein [Actinomycetota bacterium]
MTPDTSPDTSPARLGDAGLLEPALRAEVREWIAANRIEGLDPGGAHEPYDHEKTATEVEWIGRLRAGRWLCLSWPPRYGGRGLTGVQCAVVNEEFARAGLPRPHLGMGETLLAPAVLAYGTDEQRQRILPRILSGDDVYCQGFSEPDAGSDLASLRTQGVVDGDEVVITGQKVWTSGAHHANMIFTLCRTNPDAPRHRGISYVLVPMADNGVEVRPLRQMAGAFGFNQVFFAGARAPLDNVIGGLDNGWRVAMTTLGAERGGNATTQHLGYDRELGSLIELARASGRISDPILRQRLARAFIDVRLMEYAGLRLLTAMSHGDEPGPAASVDKLFWSEYHRRFGELAMDVTGTAATVRPDGPGYEISPFQRVFLESRARCIARGSSEVQRNVIAERVLGLPRD